MHHKSFETPPVDIKREEQEHAFEQLLNSFEADRTATDGYIEYSLPYPKEQLLDYLVQKKNFLLHGSGEVLTMLNPQQANDSYKESGNKEAVYAVTDPVFSIFFAIKDRSKIHGLAISSRSNEDGQITYYFAMPKDSLAKYPYKPGIVYILKRDGFIEELDNGQPSDEWTAADPVEPWAKLKVSPEDFRFLNEVQSID